MTDATRQRRDLFLAALDLPSGDREAFLCRECTDPDLRAEILELLALEPPETFLLPPDLATDPRLCAALGPYRLETQAELGPGRHLARHATNGQLAEIEVVPLAPGNADDRITAFVRTAHRLNQLRHPARILVHEHGQLATAFWYAHDRVPGQDLASLLECQRRAAAPPTAGGLQLPHPGSRAWLQALFDVFATVVDLLREAHAIGIAHGDLTPARIVLADGSRVHVTGFGVAALLGRPASPEQDLAAVAALVHATLSSAAATVAPASRTHAASPAERAALRSLLQRLDPAARPRYADVAALLADLRRVQGGRPPAPHGWTERLRAWWAGARPRRDHDDGRDDTMDQRR